MLDLEGPSRVLRLGDDQPILEAKPALTQRVAHQMYLPTPVVFTTGIADAGEHYIIANGETDLACRMTYLPKARSEENTSELQSLMRISYAAFCLKKKKRAKVRTQITNTHHI